jgi:predicted transcriptional regulator of viral defense system
VNEKYSLIKKVGGIKYKLIKVLPSRLYGLETRRVNNEDIVFASKERALIDVFEFYDVKRAYSILNDQISKINVPAFVGYLARYPVQKIRRRVGFFLEKIGVEKKLLGKIDVGGKGHTPLYDTASNRGKIDNRWRLIINE